MYKESIVIAHALYIPKGQPPAVQTNGNIHTHKVHTHGDGIRIQQSSGLIGITKKKKLSTKKRS